MSATGQKGKMTMTVFRNRIGLVCFMLFFLFSCTTVPITGRKQLSLISDSSMLSMSFQQYDEFLKSNKLSSNQAQTQMVERVGDRLKKAVEQYFVRNNMAQELKNYAWEFNLVENSEENAWCMPGGKVVVYTGILPIVRDDAGLAVVMGHEIAHAVAKHGNERMSQALAVQMGGIALSTAIAQQPSQTQNLWMQVFGVGSQYGFMLPYSRLQENEADHLGLIFMAMAGYDPHSAIGFWERMSQKKGGGIPEFLSTHPTDETRIQNIRRLIPDAMRYYGTGR